jgi:hypothetical protein
MNPRCCPRGYIVVKVLAGAEKRVLDRADYDAYQYGDGAHVHVMEDEDGVIVVRPKQQ